MLNSLLFITSCSIVMVCALLSLKQGKTMLIAWIALLGILANLFVLKQISLFGLNATASDVFAVGSLLGLNLLREHYNLKACKQAIWVSFACMVFFTVMGQIHLFYQPSPYDDSQTAYQFLLQPNPRIMAASMLVFFSIQWFDVFFYHFILKRWLRSLWARNAASLITSQSLDTILFTFLGLYGIVDSLGQIIVVSLTIKLMAIGLMVPVTSLSKRVKPNDSLLYL